MPEPSRRLVWMRAVDRDPDLEDDLDHFIALDGEEEVGVVKLVPAPAGEEWMWSLRLTHPGPAFLPTNGRTQTRGGAGPARMLARVQGVVRDRGLGRRRLGGSTVGRHNRLGGLLSR